MHPSSLRLLWGDLWRILLAAAIGAVFYVGGILLPLAVEGPVDPEQQAYYSSDWMLVADPVLGLASLVLIPLRRRYRLTTVILAAVLSALVVTAVPAFVLVLASLATTRRWRPIVAVCLLSLGLTLLGEAALVGSGAVSEGWTMGWVSLLVFQTLLLGAVVGIGAAVGARRDVVASLREQVASAEREEARRLEQARATERARIAREMHDVLAHRISLIAMHAGALAYREDLPREQVRETAALLRENADHAVTELREVLGVLRDTEEPAQPRVPQPDLTGLPGLVADLRAGGAEVELDTGRRGSTPALDLAAIPATVSRAAYRIVQEGLTNARKHAAGMPVVVRVQGGPEVGLEVEVVNAAAPPRDHPGDAAEVPPPTSRSGLGLMGLAERAELSGGRLSHGVDRAGRFRLRAWLPWPAVSAGPPTPAEVAAAPLDVPAGHAPAGSRGRP